MFIKNFFFLKKKKEKKMLAGFWPDSGQISLESGGVSPELLFEEYFGEKNQKWSRATHVTTIPSVNDGLTDRVPTLRNFETLRGYIVNF
jgi:hypothetical protein